MLHQIGTIQSLHLYPVKSMRAFDVNQAFLYWYGLNGDRKYGFVRNGLKSGFPWLTGREVPELIQYAPTFADPSQPMTSRIEVVTPSGDKVDIRSEALTDELEKAYGKSISLLQLKRGTYDCMPVSLMTPQTAESIGRNTNKPTDLRRFRSNIIIQTDLLGDSPEDDWVGHTLQFGTGDGVARVHFNYHTQRCPMVNLDPNSAEKDPTFLKTIANSRNNCVGIYGTVIQIGTLKANDPVFIID